MGGWRAGGGKLSRTAVVRAPITPQTRGYAARTGPGVIMGTVDIALRHLSERFAAELAAPFLESPGAEVHGWVETQVTAMERRLDRTLLCRVAGQPVCLHLEFQWEWKPNVPRRLFEYASMLHCTGGLVTSTAAGAPTPPGGALPVRTVVVVLQGPQSLPPGEHVYHWSWPPAAQRGFTFNVEPVYQMTTAALLARDRVWWVFAPLAVDASREKIGEVLRILSPLLNNERDPQQRQRQADMAAVMAILAEKRYKDRGLADFIVTSMEEVIMSSSLAERIEARGRVKGREEGRRALLERARQVLAPEDFAKLAALEADEHDVQDDEASEDGGKSADTSADA